MAVYWEDYFRTKSHMYAYALLRLDGEVRLKMLEISKLHYHNKSIADSWYKKMMGIVHSGELEFPINKLCELKVEEIHARMVGKDQPVTKIVERIENDDGSAITFQIKNDNGEVEISLF